SKDLVAFLNEAAAAYDGNRLSLAAGAGRACITTVAALSCRTAGGAAGTTKADRIAAISSDLADVAECDRPAGREFDRSTGSTCPGMSTGITTVAAGCLPVRPSIAADSVVATVCFNRSKSSRNAYAR